MEKAKTAEIVVVLAGLIEAFESEGFDRKHLGLPENHNVLIHELAKINGNIIICLSNGSPVAMPWLDEVNAVVEGYLGGQAGAGALLDVLSGKINPSGKLAETFPYSLVDHASFCYFANDKKQVQYREGIYVGYRFYDKAGVDVRFPFGFGLSYTTFEYTELSLPSSRILDTEETTARANITKTGNVFGKEVVQLYVRDVESTIFRPRKELKGFCKVALNPGETKTVTFTLDKRSLHVTSTVEFDEKKNDLREHLPLMYDVPQRFEMSEETYSTMYGKAVPKPKPIRPYTSTSTLEDTKDTWLSRLLIRLAENEITRMFGRDSAESKKAVIELYKVSALGVPICNFGRSSGGKFNVTQTEGLVDIFNRRYLRGFYKVLFG